jgi:tripeptide aminopeptidase
LCLNQELKIYLRESEFPELKNYIGDDLLVTDGTSLLGQMIKPPSPRL